jgi:hypothetical protein
MKWCARRGRPQPHRHRRPLVWRLHDGQSAGAHALFRAGIARSGAYNRTLTPFGFQAEERSFWQAPAVYQAMSPFNYADKIKDALLMIHGEQDNNSGTFPIQSERMFQAVRAWAARRAGDAAERKPCLPRARIDHADAV